MSSSQIPTPTPEIDDAAIAAEMRVIVSEALRESEEIGRRLDEAAEARVAARLKEEAPKRSSWCFRLLCDIGRSRSDKKSGQETA